MQAKPSGTIIRQGQHAPPKVLIGARPVVRPQVKRGKVNAVHHMVGQEVLTGVQGPLVLAIFQERTGSAYPQPAGCQCHCEALCVPNKEAQLLGIGQGLLILAVPSGESKTRKCLRRFTKDCQVASHSATRPGLIDGGRVSLNCKGTHAFIEEDEMQMGDIPTSEM